MDYYQKRAEQLKDFYIKTLRCEECQRTMEFEDMTEKEINDMYSFLSDKNSFNTLSQWDRKTIYGICCGDILQSLELSGVLTLC